MARGAPARGSQSVPGGDATVSQTANCAYVFTHVYTTLHGYHIHMHDALTCHRHDNSCVDLTNLCLDACMLVRVFDCAVDGFVDVRRHGTYMWSHRYRLVHGVCLH